MENVLTDTSQVGSAGHVRAFAMRAARLTNVVVCTPSAGRRGRTADVSMMLNMFFGMLRSAMIRPTTWAS
jgi:hypothetical protein